MGINITPAPGSGGGGPQLWTEDINNGTLYPATIGDVVLIGNQSTLGTGACLEVFGDIMISGSVYDSNSVYSLDVLGRQLFDIYGNASFQWAAGIYGLDTLLKGGDSLTNFSNAGSLYFYGGNGLGDNEIPGNIRFEAGSNTGTTGQDGGNVLFYAGVKSDSTAKDGYISFARGVIRMSSLPSSDPADGTNTLWADPVTRVVKLGT